LMPLLTRVHRQHHHWEHARGFHGVRRRNVAQALSSVRESLPSRNRLQNPIESWIALRCLSKCTGAQATLICLYEVVSGPWSIAESNRKPNSHPMFASSSSYASSAKIKLIDACLLVDKDRTTTVVVSSAIPSDKPHNPPFSKHGHLPD